MSVSNYSKQVAKRQRIKETTLVVGLDIGSAFNAMAFMNNEGNVLGRYPRVYNSRKGFEFFIEAINMIMRKNELNDVIIGMEPTGHYWRKIAYFANEKGYEVRFIRTTALKHQRELDLSSIAKSDIKDAIVIANIVREGKYIETAIQDGTYRQLRTLSRTRERISQYHRGSTNALRAAIDDYFPELLNIFWSVKSKGLLALLTVAPFPTDVLKLDTGYIADVIATASRRRKEAYEKAVLVRESAKISIGLKKLDTGDRFRIKILLNEVIRADALLKEIETEMKTLIENIPYSKYLLSIPGIGMLSAAVFLGELGDPANFTNSKQIIKYAGYDPVESDSGMRISSRRISKKGRWLLRKILYFMSMHVICNSAYFKGYYDEKQKKRNRFGRVISKKEALCAVVIKLVKVIFALFRDARVFSDEPVKLALTA